MAMKLVRRTCVDHLICMSSLHSTQGSLDVLASVATAVSSELSEQAVKADLVLIQPWSVALPSLYVATSSTPTAGNGLFASSAMSRGTIIGVTTHPAPSQFHAYATPTFTLTRSPPSFSHQRISLTPPILVHLNPFA